MTTDIPASRHTLWYALIGTFSTLLLGGLIVVCLAVGGVFRHPIRGEGKLGSPLSSFDFQRHCFNTKLLAHYKTQDNVDALVRLYSSLVSAVDSDSTREGLRFDGVFHPWQPNSRTEARVLDYCVWLNTFVAPLWSGTPLTLYLPVDFEDGSSQPNVLAFSNSHPTSVLVPDPYSRDLHYVKAALDAPKLSWREKKPQAIFVGASTGGQDGMRLRYARQFKNHPSILVKISSWCQGEEPDARLEGPVASVEEQLQYRYILSLDGNSASWGRVNWGMFSSSVVLKAKSDQKLWYYQLLQDHVHFLEVDESTLENVVNNTTSLQHENIVRQANLFAHTHLTALAPVVYWCCLLEKVVLRGAL